MLEKTKAIVLHQIRFTDSGIIVHFYTREFGRMPVLIKGMRSKKSGKAASMFQPMSLLDIEFYNKPSRQVQLLREISVSHAFLSIHSDIKKSVVMLFLAEVLSSFLVEEIPNHLLFDYIERSVIWFDESQEKFSNFHISFLCGLSSFLGFEPAVKKNREDNFFDMLNGRFAPVPPVHGEYISGHLAEMMGSFLSTSPEDSAGIAMTGRQRNEMAETIIRYYLLHQPSVRKINSLEVLKEVFG
ncbi:MAG TPA: DNA repair protein RecO [Bacteroidales bacterium]|nr:DNA repair protein RecO [Bacteroidales bacterium]